MSNASDLELLGRVARAVLTDASAVSPSTQYVAHE
jgi:hypothetical protein